MRTILLNPGPVTLSERVRGALARPDLCHREVEFSELQARIRLGLVDVYGLGHDAWASVLLTGSGTAAVEAMLASLTPREGRLLVVENGAYGERLSAIARVHGLAHRAVTFPWGAPIDTSAIAEALESEPDITHLAVVHHETTTGRLNDLAALAPLCSAHGVGMLVDAVSSFAGEPIDFAQWNVSACAATANKCLHGVPAVSFVLARRDALEGSEPRTVYLDLGGYYREQERGGTPFTQSVQGFYALDEALAELRDQGGWPARHRRYAELSAHVRSELEALGIAPLLPARETSVTLSAFELPPGLDYPSLHDALKARGIVIYAGQGALRDRIFRIAVMGDIGRDDLDRMLGGVRARLESS